MPALFQLFRACSPLGLSLVLALCVREYNARKVSRDQARYPRSLNVSFLRSSPMKVGNPVVLYVFYERRCTRLTSPIRPGVSSRMSWNLWEQWTTICPPLSAVSSPSDSYLRSRWNDTCCCFRRKILPLPNSPRHFRPWRNKIQVHDQSLSSYLSCPAFLDSLTWSCACDSESLSWGWTHHCLRKNCRTCCDVVE